MLASPSACGDSGRGNRDLSATAVTSSDAFVSRAARMALLHSACFHRTTVAAAMTVLLPSAEALAQCAPPPPAAVSISSGNCEDPAFTARESAGTVVEVTGTGSYSATSTHLLVTNSGYGAHATGGGTISFTGLPDDSTTLSEITTYGLGSHALYAEGGGLITGDNIAIYTNDAGAYGVGAVGAASSVTLSDGAVNTFGDGSHGVYAASGGTIILTRTDIQTYGAGASAVFVDAGGSITLNNLNTYSNGDHGPGAVASGAGSSLTLNKTYVNVTSNGSAGLFADGGGMVTMNGGAIASGDYYGGTVIANTPGIVARGTGSSIQVSNGATSATYGANSPGVWADAGATIDFSGYGIFTYQPNSPGASASGAGSTVTLTNTIVRTSGPWSAGLLVTDAGTITVTNTEVTTGFRVTGGNPPVLQFPDAQIGLEAHGAEVVGAGSRLQAENADFTTNGDGAVGVRISQGGIASIVGSTIATRGDDTITAGGADGVRVNDAGSHGVVTGTLITTAGMNGVGLHARAGGTIVAKDVRLATQGQNARGVQAQEPDSTIALTRTAIITGGTGAAGVQADNGGTVQIVGGSVATTGSTAHGFAAINGGTVNATGTAVSATGAGSTAIYLAGKGPSAISVTGGSLTATDGAIIRAEGGDGTVSISGGTTINPAIVNGRLLLAQVTEDAAAKPAKLTLNITGLPSLTGDIIVDPSTLSYNLSNSNWAGNLLLTGSGNTATASLTTARWTGDLLADADNTADVALAQGSLWTGLARNATDVAIDGSSAWDVTGDSNATGTVTNAGLIQFLARPGAYSTLTVRNYAGNNGRIGFNTYLESDNSPSNLLVIDGGRASGTSSVLVDNAGGPGAQTVADGIRLVQVTRNGTTATNAFTLGQRVAAGAYEYQLFRGGSTGADDWFLRSHLVNPPTTPTAPSGPDIPLYRPEVALYAPIPAIGRQMGLATLGTLHERVGEEENIRNLTGRGYVNGGWGRVFGENTRNQWDGTVDSRAAGDLVGIQAGLDVIRTDPYAGGHRDHLGVYGAYTDYSAHSVSGFALGIENLRVGRLSMAGPSLGAYWTHFGPSGWYVDAVFQGNWYDINARSDYGAALSTDATGYTASVEAGYPIRFGEGNRWQIEPQAQIISQTISVNRSSDAYSGVSWDEGHAWTGRLGARLQYTDEDAQGRLWQPYARVNLWHAFSGNDSAIFGSASPAIETRFGDTALELGGGVTARVNQNVSIYGQGSYRWSLDGNRSRQTATAGTIGIRLNW